MTIKLVPAVVAVCAIAVVSPAPASAVAPGAATSTMAARTTVLEQRVVTSEVVKRNGKLIFKGKVSPGHANRSVFMQKKDCRKCDWKPFAKVLTDDASRYRVRIYAPRTGAWFWRAKVRAYGGYATSYSGVWKTYRS